MRLEKQDSEMGNGSCRMPDAVDNLRAPMIHANGDSP